VISNPVAGSVFPFRGDTDFAPGEGEWIDVEEWRL
jgi:hypothetical protein